MTKRRYNLLNKSLFLHGLAMRIFLILILGSFLLTFLPNSSALAAPKKEKDIVSTVLYGKPSDLIEILNAHKHEKHYAKFNPDIDDRDIALYAALLFDKKEMAEILFRYNAKFPIVLIDTSELKKKRNITTKTIHSMNEDLDPDAGGDCGTYDPASIFIDVSPNMLGVILQNRREWCTKKDNCDRRLKNIFSDDRQYLQVIRKYCK